MEDTRFDGIVRNLGDVASRRAAGRLLAGGALAGLAGWLGLSQEGEAKKKRKKRKKDRCPSGLPKKCPPTSLDPKGLCVPSGFTCCSDALGGGACTPENPQCCAPTFQDPAGLCVPGGSVCCTSAEGGGFCGPGSTCCPPIPGFPDGLCALPGFECPLGVTSSRASGVSERMRGVTRRSAAR